MSENVRILIADDEPLATERLETLLGRRDDIDHVGSASDGEEAVALATDALPDIVLLDIAMPGLDGIEVARALSKIPKKRDRFLGVLRVVRCCLSVPELGNLPGTTKHHRTPGEPPRRDASLRSHAPSRSSVRAKIPSISM